MKVLLADKSKSDTETQQLTSQMKIKVEEIEHLTFEAVLKKHDDMILDMVRRQTALALERLHKEKPDTQAVSAKGKRMGAELIIEMLEATPSCCYCLRTFSFPRRLLREQVFA